MKRISLIVLSLLLLLCTVTGTTAATVDGTPTSEKVVIRDENWAYEKVRVYGWEIDEYVGTATEASIPWSFAKEYITTVGSYAFNGNNAVTVVNTTGVLEAIGDYAFNGCSSLEQITLYDSLTTLGVGSFYGCGALTDINLEDTSITAVPAYCFADCGFSKLKLPETCTAIGNMAFYQCTAMTKIWIPASVTEIADSAFLNCPDCVIYCYTDSAAHEYAVSKGIGYVLIDAPTEVSFLLGDADGDNKITILDATKVQRLLAEFVDDVDGMIAVRGDCIGDGADILDATKIQRYLADLYVAEPINTIVTRSVVLPIIW